MKKVHLKGYFFRKINNFNILMKNFSSLKEKNEEDKIENGENKDLNKLDKKNYSFDEVEEILVKLKNMELEVDQLPKEFIPFSKELEEFLLKYKIIDPNTCCGSGCSNCVMEEYEDNFSIFGPALRELTKKINDNILL